MTRSFVVLFPVMMFCFLGIIIGVLTGLYPDWLMNTFFVGMIVVAGGLLVSIALDNLAHRR